MIYTLKGSGTVEAKSGGRKTLFIVEAEWVLFILEQAAKYPSLQSLMSSIVSIIDFVWVFVIEKQIGTNMFYHRGQILAPALPHRPFYQLMLETK